MRPIVSGFTIHVISDSLGDTAAAVAEAAASQFDHGAAHIERLAKVKSGSQIRSYLEERLSPELIVFHTIANPVLRKELVDIASHLGVTEVDLIGPAISALSSALDRTPSGVAGVLRVTDTGYFRRIGATEFAVEHDDGRNVESLTDADIVLIGVSRTSKTPLSMYLASRGYLVANVPLVPGVEAPPQLYDVEPHRIFGLVSNEKLLAAIRSKRLGEAGTVARSYADPEAIRRELKEARAFMRRLGCIVVHTDNRAIEETAQEILHYYSLHEARLD